MFTAIILACHALIPDACMELTDNRGPYRTEQVCKERLQEMVKDTIRIWYEHETPVTIEGVKCERSDGA